MSGGVPRRLSGDRRAGPPDISPAGVAAKASRIPDEVAAPQGRRPQEDRVTEPQADRNPPTTIYVCVTCRTEGEPALPLEARAGRRLLGALQAAVGPGTGVELVGVECLSVCKRPCTVSFAAPGKWTYVYGDLPPETAAPVVIEAARLYGATPDGLIPWKQRPAAIKTGVVARVPPSPTPEGQAA